MNTSYTLLVAAILGLSLAGSASCRADENGEGGTNTGAVGGSGEDAVEKPEEDTTGRFDHGRWDRLLARHVTREGWVDYAGLRRRDAKELQAYLDELARADIEDLRDDDERKAFWINAYNAVCVRKLLDNDIPKSVPKALFFGTNIFEERTYTIAGEKRSLDDIEHGILRPKFRDNRVHAVLVCGASSCPRLRTEAYVGRKLDAQLDEECRSWINDEKTLDGERKNFLDRRRATFHGSKIFSWYKEDFGGTDAGVLEFVKRFIDASDREFIEKNDVRVKFLDYDWTLNRQK